MGTGRPWRKQREDHWTSVAVQLQDDRARRFVASEGDKDDGALADIRMIIKSCRQQAEQLRVRAPQNGEDEVMKAKALSLISESARNLAIALETIRTPGLGAKEALTILAGQVVNNTPDGSGQ